MHFAATLALGLEANGYHTLHAANAMVGWELPHAHLPDLILSDIEMPGKDGRRLLEEMRADPELADRQFVLMTGKAAYTNPRAAMNLGADLDILDKKEIRQELRDIRQCGRRLHRSLRNYLWILALESQQTAPSSQVLATEAVAEALAAGINTATLRHEQTADLVVDLMGTPVRAEREYIGMFRSQPHNLAHTQTGGIRRHQQDAMFEVEAVDLQQLGNLLRTVDAWPQDRLASMKPTVARLEPRDAAVGISLVPSAWFAAKCSHP